MISQKQNNKFFRYVSVGALAAALEYLSFALIFYVFKGGIGVAQTSSFLIGFAVSFVLNSIWTFVKKNDIKREVYWSRFFAYAILALINIGVTALFITILHKFGVSPLIAKLIVMGAVVIWNYTIFNKIIFTDNFLKKVNVKNLKKLLYKIKNPALFSIIIIVFGLVYIFITPPGVGHDEYAHIIKADSTSRLDLIPKEMTWVTPSGIEETFYAYKASDSLANYAGKAFNSRNSFNDKEIAKAVKRQGAERYNVQANHHDGYGAAGYNSIGYVPAAIGLKIARNLDLTVHQAVIVAKISSLLTCALLAGLSFYVLSGSRLRYLVFFVVLFPPIIFSFTTISLDGMLNSVSILFLALLLSILINKHKGQCLYKNWKYILAVLCAIILPLLKLPFLVLSVLIVFLGITKKPKDRGKVRLITVVVACLIILPTLAWSLIGSAPNAVQSSRVNSGGEPHPAEQVKWILSHPIKYTKLAGESLMTLVFPRESGRVVMLLNEDYILNRNLVMIYTLMLMLVCIYIGSAIRAVYKKNKNFFIVLACAVGLTALGIITAIYVAANGVGNNNIWGVQVRYFLPLMIWGVLLTSLGIRGVKQTEYAKSLYTLIAIAIILNSVIAADYWINISELI